ncbi:MAG: hypothetical protein KKB46_02375, partial [Candidatus Omnitrophica bacterium]|nr:hypothetical protein [Candidatus Omnitrophota bacterium]
MSEYNKKKDKGFLKKFCKSGSIARLKQVFSDIMGSKRTKCMFMYPDCTPIKSNQKTHPEIAKALRRKLLEAVENFTCLCGKYCIAIPVKQGDKVYGYIIGLHMKQPLDKTNAVFVKIYVDLALKEFQKEQELTKLYDTIRP